MKKIGIQLVFTLALLIPGVISAQTVASQSTLIITPYGNGGFIVSTTTANGGKLQATSTPFFTNGITTGATSTGSKGFNISGGCFAIGGICISGSTGGITALGSGYATTTGTTITHSTSTLSFNGLTFGQAITVPNSSVLLFTPTVTGTLNNSGLTNSSVTVNSTSIALGASGTITAASSSVLGDNNAFTGRDTFTNATTTLLTIGTAWWTPQTGVLVGNGTSPVTAGTTQTCTNQFFRSLSAAYSVTCATVNLASDVSGTLQATNFPALTGDITTSAGSLGTTLATVNGNVGSFTNANITVNGKGLITAASNGSSSGSGTISTSSALVSGQGVYATGVSTIASIATSTPAAGGPITYSGTFGSFFGGSSGSFGCTAASGGANGCLSSTDWTTFNNKQSALTFTWPLINMTGTVTFGGLSTSSAAVVGNIPYFSGVNTFANVATTSLGVTGPITFSGTLGAQLGGANGSFGCATCNTSNATVSSVGLSDSNSTLTIGGTPVTTSGTLTATLNLAHPNSWTGLQQFINASSSLFSVTNKAYFGGSGTSTFSSTGNLTLVNAANALTIPALGTAAGTFLAADASGNVIATTTPAGSGAVSSVSNADGTLTISPTTGAVVSSLALGHANTWTGQQTFNTSAPIFGTLSGLLQGNGASAVTAVAGTAGQFPYYNGANTLLATSTIFLTPASAVGIGTLTPSAKFDVQGTSTAATGQIADFWKSDGTNVMRIRNDGNVGIGTTTPWARLSISTSAQQNGLLPLFAVSSTTNASLFNVFGNGNVGIGTTSPDNTFTVEGSAPTNGGSFAVFRNIGSTNIGALRLDAAPGAGNANLFFSTANVTKGSVGYDGTRNFLGFLNNAYSSNDFSLRVNLDGSFTYNDGVTSNELFRINANGRVGIGTTTPWGKLSVASPSMVAADYANPLFIVATSSDATGQMFQVNATTSILSGITSSFVESGVRIAVGVWNRAGSLFANTGVLDQLYVSGRINQDWAYISCDSFPITANLTAVTANFCGDLVGSGAAGGAGSLLASAATGDSIATFVRMQITSTNSNTGVGVFAASAPALLAATSTPVMESMARLALVQASVDAFYFIGFANTNPLNAATIDTTTTAGCYFVASSTRANWAAMCQTNATTMTIVDTGIASSTVTTGAGAAYMFRVQMDNTKAEFFIKSAQGGSFNKVATITGTYPSTVALVPGVFFYNGATAVANKAMDVMSFRTWWQRVLPQS